LTDEIVELAQEVGIAPSFPIPNVLATRIKTPESFGIIPIPTSIAADYSIQRVKAPVIQGIPHL
jgi:hypothetical protein